MLSPEVSSGLYAITKGLIHFFPVVISNLDGDAKGSFNNASL